MSLYICSTCFAQLLCQFEDQEIVPKYMRLSDCTEVLNQSALFTQFVPIFVIKNICIVIRNLRFDCHARWRGVFIHRPSHFHSLLHPSLLRIFIRHCKSLCSHCAWAVQRGARLGNRRRRRCRLPLLSPTPPIILRPTRTPDVSIHPSWPRRQRSSA